MTSGVPCSPARSDFPYEAFDETLRLDEVFALCDRFELPPPAVFQGTGVMRIGDADRPDVFATALARFTQRRPDTGLEGVERALGVLAAPQVLVSVQRSRPTDTVTCFVASAGGTVVEHRPLPDNLHNVAIVPSTSALARAVEFCGLAQRPVSPGATVSITAAQLLDAGALASAGDLAGAAEILRGAGSDEATALFLRALAQPPTAVQVTVLDRPAPGRLAGTVTAWLDAGDAGLWRVPAAEVAPFGAAGVVGAETLHGILEIRAVTESDLLEEIAEGFADELRP